VAQMELQDNRIRRTRDAVVGAFRELVTRRRYDELKVADIIEKAGVARSTFYQHYENKDDVLREGLSGPFGALVDSLSEHHDACRLTDTMQHIWDNRRTGNLLFKGRLRPVLTRMLVDLMERRFNENGTNKFQRSVPIRLVAQHIASGQIAMIAAWIAGEGSCSPSAIAEALRQSGRASLHALGVISTDS
jgi:AcrR family transcriptional regulator